MKKLISLFVVAFCVSGPSFGAEHILTHSAKEIGKGSYKVTKASIEDLGKGGHSVLKVVF